MVQFDAPSLVGLWCMYLQVSHGLLVPAQTLTAPCGGHTRAPPPVASAPRGALADTVDEDDLCTSSTEFQRFVERRQQSGASGRVVLDLRPSADFRREHLVGSTSIPVDELEPRLLELPPPFAQPVGIIGSEEDLWTARDFLTGKGWQIDAEIRIDTGFALSAALPTEVGPRSSQVWRANDFLEFCMERFLLPSALGGSDPTGSVLDLGCGSGRDTVYMAQRLPPGTRVIGVDNHSYALERGAKLADRWVDAPRGGGGEGPASCSRGDLEEVGAGAAPDGYCYDGGGRTGEEGVDARRACEWLLADLRKEGSLEGLRASVVHGHRFKCEQLLPLLRDYVLLPGGYFVWSTFLDTGTENAVPPWRPSRMMRPGELASIFSGNDFEILVDEQGELPTRGSVVPANFFACRKRSG